MPGLVLAAVIGGPLVAVPAARQRFRRGTVDRRIAVHDHRRRGDGQRDLEDLARPRRRRISFQQRLRQAGHSDRRLSAAGHRPVGGGQYRAAVGRPRELRGLQDHHRRPAGGPDHRSARHVRCHRRQRATQAAQGAAATARQSRAPRGRPARRDSQRAGVGGSPWCLREATIAAGRALRRRGS